MSLQAAETPKMVEISTFLKEQVQWFSVLKENFKIAQQRMKFYADQHRTERVFAAGDWVYPAISTG